MPTTAPYGTWSSPIDAATVARAGRRLGAAALAEDGAVWWAEGRPTEGGRVVLMRRRRPGREPEEVTPKDVNVRTRVHEYGGGAWCLDGPDLVLFTSFADQRLYRQRLGEAPVAITPEPETTAGLRYADLRITPDGATVICVREVHGEGEPENQVVSLALDGSGEPAVLASGRDFYSFPRVSPDGRWLAWTCWDHPNMPWDGTELWLAPLADTFDARRVAGGPAESVFQPEWDAEGRLHFVSDRDGWWNLYRLDRSAASRHFQLTAEQADLAHPQWLFGGATYAFLEDGSIACVRCGGAEECLFVLDPGAERLRNLGLPFTAFGFPSLAARGTMLTFAAATPEREASVVLLDVPGGETEIVRRRRARPRSIPPTSRSRERSSSRPAAARSPTASTTRPPTPASKAPRGNGRR